MPNIQYTPEEIQKITNALKPLMSAAVNPSEEEMQAAVQSQLSKILNVLANSIMSKREEAMEQEFDEKRNTFF